MIHLKLLVCVAALNAITFEYVLAESQLKTLKKRVRLIERHLREEIDLLREEFGLELGEIKQIQKSFDLSSTGRPTDGGENHGDVDQLVTLNMLENVEKDLLTKFAQIQKGLQSEKIWRRDVQYQMQNDQQKTVDIIGILTEIGNNLTSHLGVITLKNIENKIIEMIESQSNLIESLNKTICSKPKQNSPNAVESRDSETAKQAVNCVDLYKIGHVTSGEYEIYPKGLGRPLRVYCDMDTDGGGWTVFQRRCDGSENFTRPWEDYKFGFGNLSAEFWLGNEYVSRMTSQAPHQLRIELEDFKNNRRYAKYSSFNVAPLSELYKLTIGVYNGNAMDSFRYHNNKSFSTFDRDNKGSCAEKYKGGFWYINCHMVNINGLYEFQKRSGCMNWYLWKGYVCLKFTEMKFRPEIH